MNQSSNLSDINKAIKNAQSYPEYKEACAQHDAISGANDWKADDETSDFDFRLIQKRLSRIKTALTRKDATALISILHEGIHGNLGNLSSPELEKHSKIGTKVLIETFLNTVCEALEFIYNADEDDVDFYQKLSFFEETAHAFGQSCLMLSGGAGLGFFHAGVVKAMLEEDLIPQVVSGSSAGSIIAALVGTRNKDELKQMLTAESIYAHFHQWSKYQGFKKDGFFDSTPLENALIEIFDLTTFEEAYNKTGIDLTITVSPADLHQNSRLLNSRTSPNAIITQSVRASCAIPYIFPPVYLKAKNQLGEVVPFIPHRKFADGSLMADLPFERLARIYGLNHSIVSQTNPLAQPFLANTKNKSNSIAELTWRHAANLTKKNSIYFFDVLEAIGSNDNFKLGVHKLRSIVDQQYVGNINIIPKRKITDFKQLFSNPSLESLTTQINQAEKATWPFLDVIRRNTLLAKTFRKYLNLLKIKEAEKLKSS
jgi:predicted acylesterase/phospholipase RssA